MAASRKDLCRINLKTSSVGLVVDVLKGAKEAPGVVLVDGLDLQDDGTFANVVIWMDSAESRKRMAAAFAQQQDVTVTQG